MVDVSKTALLVLIVDFRRLRGKNKADENVIGLSRLGKYPSPPVIWETNLPSLLKAGPMEEIGDVGADCGLFFVGTQFACSEAVFMMVGCWYCKHGQDKSKTMGLDACLITCKQ